MSLFIVLALVQPQNKCWSSSPIIYGQLKAEKPHPLIFCQSKTYCSSLRFKAKTRAEFVRESYSERKHMSLEERGWRFIIRMAASHLPFVWLMYWICRGRVELSVQRRLDERKPIKATIKSEICERSAPNLSNSSAQIDLWVLTIPGKSSQFRNVNAIFKKWMEGIYLTPASPVSLECNYCCVSRRCWD